jgi:hypothetical protein
MVYRPGDWVRLTSGPVVRVLGGPAWGFYAVEPYRERTTYVSTDADLALYGVPIGDEYSLVMEEYVAGLADAPVSRSERASGGRCLARNCGEWNEWVDGDFVCYRCRSEGRRCA